MSRALITNRAKTNGHVHIPALPVRKFDNVPEGLESDIVKAFEQEGLMNQPAEIRILTAIDDNHKETLKGIADLKQTSHEQDKRLLLVEVSQKDVLAAVSDIKEAVEPQEVRLIKLETSMAAFTRAQTVADEERRDTKRLVKAAVIVAVVGLGVTAILGYYGLKGTSNTAAAVAATAVPAQEAKRQDEVLSVDVKELTKAILQDREERKREAAAVRTSRRGRARAPEPIPSPDGPGAKLKELIAPGDMPIPPMTYSYNQFFLEIPRLPE